MSRTKNIDAPAVYDLFKVLVEYKRRNQGATPSLDELAEMTGSSKSGTRHRLRLLQEDTAIVINGYKDIRINGGFWEMD